MESKAAIPSKVDQVEGTIPPISEAKPAEQSDTNVTLTKKTVFRKYLQKSGFKYAIIRAIVALYEDPQKPDDPLSWMLGLLGHGIPSMNMLENFQSEANALRARIEILQQENSQLQSQIDEREAALQPDPMAEFDWKGLMNYDSEEENTETANT